MHRLTLGSLELYLLDDGTLRYPASAFFANVAEAVWRPQAKPDSEGRISVGHNCALVRTARELVIIDTGYGDDTHDGAVGHLLEDLARTGYHRNQVSMVVNTHAHGDHIKRNTMMHAGDRRPTFPNARYHLAEADWEWFADRGRAPEFDEHIASLDRFGVLARVRPHVRLTPEVLLLPTPGHTPGHTSVLIEAGGTTVIFLGDLCHHPLHFAHPDWVSKFDTDPAVTPRTREDLFKHAAKRDALVICPHAVSPGLGRVVQAGSRFYWAPVT